MGEEEGSDKGRGQWVSIEQGVGEKATVGRWGVVDAGA